MFEFFRNTDLDARSFFATYTEKFNLNQFGGSVGGPIKKDKTFFFADIQNKVSAARDSVHGPGSHRWRCATAILPTTRSAIRAPDF